MITFSIITVTYNADSILECTLRSVAGQTWPHVEHILIDGSSTDHTLDVARLHGQHLARIVSEPDRGLYDAMNKGLRLATGHYVLFLNAGDSLHAPNTLERINEEVARAMSDDQLVTHSLPGVLYGHTDIVDSSGRRLGPRRLSPPSVLTWRSFSRGMLVCHQAFYARRDLCPPYDVSFRFSADFDWCIRVMQRADRLLPLPFTVADYLSEGMTTRNHRASLLERFRLMCRHYGLLLTLFRHLSFLFRMGKR